MDAGQPPYPVMKSFIDHVSEPVNEPTTMKISSFYGARCNYLLDPMLDHIPLQNLGLHRALQLLPIVSASLVFRRDFLND